MLQTIAPYSVTVLPAGLSFDSGNCELKGTPTVSLTTSAAFSVQATFQSRPSEVYHTTVFMNSSPAPISSAAKIYSPSAPYSAIQLFPGSMVDEVFAIASTNGDPLPASMYYCFATHNGFARTKQEICAVDNAYCISENLNADNTQGLTLSAGTNAGQKTNSATGPYPYCVLSGSLDSPTAESYNISVQITDQNQNLSFAYYPLTVVGLPGDQNITTPPPTDQLLSWMSNSLIVVGPLPANMKVSTSVTACSIEPAGIVSSLGYTVIPINFNPSGYSLTGVSTPCTSGCNACSILPSQQFLEEYNALARNPTVDSMDVFLANNQLSPVNVIVNVTMSDPNWPLNQNTPTPSRTAIVSQPFSLAPGLARGN
jgi:hypothetical protein